MTGINIAVEAFSTQLGDWVVKPTVELPNRLEFPRKSVSALVPRTAVCRSAGEPLFGSLGFALD